MKLKKRSSLKRLSTTSNKMIRLKMKSQQRRKPNKLKLIKSMNKKRGSLSQSQKCGLPTLEIFSMHSKNCTKSVMDQIGVTRKTPTSATPSSSGLAPSKAC